MAQFPGESGNEVPCLPIMYTFLPADGIDLVWKDGVLGAAGLKDQQTTPYSQRDRWPSARDVLKLSGLAKLLTRMAVRVATHSFYTAIMTIFSVLPSRPIQVIELDSDMWSARPSPLKVLYVFLRALSPSAGMLQGRLQSCSRVLGVKAVVPDSALEESVCWTFTLCFSYH